MIAIGAKRFTVRSWRPEYRGPLAIHASLRFPKRLCWISGEPQFARPLVRAGILPSAELVPTLGHVIAITTLTGCFEAEHVAQHCGITPGSEEYELDRFPAGKFAWRLDSARRLKSPYKCHGTKGFFFVPDYIEEGLV